MSPIVSILLRMDEGELSIAQDAVNRLRKSLGTIDAEIILVDATTSGLADLSGVCVVRDTSPCRATGWKTAARQASAPYITWHDPRTEIVGESWQTQIDTLENNPRIKAVVGGVEIQGRDRSTSDSSLGEEPQKVDLYTVWTSRAIIRREVLGDLEETLYAPNETALLVDLVDQGLVDRVSQIAVRWPSRDYDFEEARSAFDRKCLSLNQGDAALSNPKMSVIICTYNRKNTLLRCLESFCRQVIAPGTFEIIITDDSSTDGTASVLANAQWPVPVKFIARPKGSLAEARNEAISVAQGDLLLLINDDTIAYPNLVEQHLAIHSEVNNENVAVLGTFDQPPAALECAIMQAIEHSSFGFPYEGMAPETFYNWHKFWTCNLSVRTSVLRSVGGFDEDYSFYGCEDSDLGYRLEQKGLRVYYTERARAFHDHTMDLKSVGRRQKTLARANVRFFAKNSEALNESTWQGLKSLTKAQCIQALTEKRLLTETIARAAHGLSQVNVSALNALQGGSSDIGNAITEHLKQLLNQLNGHWWAEGSIEGFQELGIDGYADIVSGKMGTLSRKLRDSGSREIWPLNTQAKKKVLVWPQFDNEDLRTLFLEYGSTFVDNPSFCLCIRHDSLLDGTVESAREALEHAFDRYIGAHKDMDVLLVSETMSAYDWPRLGRSVDAALVLPSSASATRRAFYSALGAETMTSARDLQTLATPLATSLA